MCVFTLKHFISACRAQVGQPRAVYIVYFQPSWHGLRLSKHNRTMINITADYNALHWRPPEINGMHFAELDSYDICGL